MAAENTMINYLSRHFDHRKIPVPLKCRLGVRRLRRIFEVPFSVPVLACLEFDKLFYELHHYVAILT